MAAVPRPNNPNPTSIPPNGNITKVPTVPPAKDHRNAPQTPPWRRCVRRSTTSMPRPKPAAVTTGAVSVTANEGGTGGRGMRASTAMSHTANMMTPPSSEPSTRKSALNIADLPCRHHSAFDSPTRHSFRLPNWHSTVLGSRVLHGVARRPGNGRAAAGCALDSAGGTAPAMLLHHAA